MSINDHINNATKLSHDFGVPYHVIHYRHDVGKDGVWRVAVVKDVDQNRLAENLGRVVATVHPNGQMEDYRGIA